MPQMTFGQRVTAGALGSLIGATVFTFLLGPGAGTALGAKLGGMCGGGCN